VTLLDEPYLAFEAIYGRLKEPFQVKSCQVTNLRLPRKWHVLKEGQEGNDNKQQRRGLLVFFEPPSLPSAGSRRLKDSTPV
jgi:hypothetical protein